MPFNNQPYNLTNNATSLLTGNILAGATTFSVTTSTGAYFPAAPFVFTLISADKTKTEICLCTAISGDTFTTIVRAYEAVQGASTAFGFSTGDTVELRLTAGIMDVYSNQTNFGIMNMIAKNALFQ